MEIRKEKDEEISQIGHIKQTKLLGRIKPNRGHKIFELNLLTGEISEAKLETNVDFYLKKHRKIKVNPNCIYHGFLNLKNAKKKFKQILKNI